MTDQYFALANARNYYQLLKTNLLGWRKDATIYCFISLSLSLFFFILLSITLARDRASRWCREPREGLYWIARTCFRASHFQQRAGTGARKSDLWSSGIAFYFSAGHAYPPRGINRGYAGYRWEMHPCTLTFHPAVACSRGCIFRQKKR